MTDVYHYPTISHPLNATIQLPGSKSITNRALLIAALAHGLSRLDNCLDSDDTSAMKNALTTLGIELHPLAHASYHISGCHGIFANQSARIHCVDAGTVLRFLLPVCAYQPGRFEFDGTEQLTGRPIAPLLEVLKHQGVGIQHTKTAQSLPVIITGTTHPKSQTIHISSHISSQFLSGLLLASPLTRSEVILTTEHMVSEPYIEMTCYMMRQFGVDVQRTDQNRFRILPNQSYQGTTYLIEPDLSTASYFFAAAALTNGALTLTQVNRTRCLQGDEYFLTILEKMGCSVHSSQHAITVIGSPQLNGIEVNIQHCSDLFMTIACLAAFATGPSTLSGIRHIRYKESDRIAATQQNLAKLGVQMIDTEDTVTIFPAPIQPALLESYGDHRMVMAFALCGLKTPGIRMNHASCVAKTCPDFTSRWTAIGCNHS